MMTRPDVRHAGLVDALRETRTLQRWAIRLGFTEVAERLKWLGDVLADMRNYRETR